MSSEKSKTVEEQLCFSSLIWSAVRGLSQENLSLETEEFRPIKASYYLYMAFLVWPKNRVFLFVVNLNAASAYTFSSTFVDHLAARTKMIFLEKFLKIFRRFDRTSDFSFRFLDLEKRIGPRFYLFLSFFFFVTFHRYLEQIENTTEHIARD